MYFCINLGIEGSGKPKLHYRLWNVFPRGGCLAACNLADRWIAEKRPGQLESIADDRMRIHDDCTLS